MLEFDFLSDLGYWVHMTAHRFECAMNAELAGEGITYRQCQVLAWLALEGEQSQADLARHMHVEASTIVKVLDRMERDDLIVREPYAGDRRLKIIRPTKKAVPVWKRIVTCAERVRGRATQGMSEKEVALVRKLLERVHDNLTSPVEPSRQNIREQE